MASLTHGETLNYAIALKDRNHLKGAPRAHTDITVEDELMKDTGSISFIVVRLCTAIIHGCSVNPSTTNIQHYCYDEADFKEIIHWAKPILNYAIERNLPEIVAILFEAFGEECSNLFRQVYNGIPGEAVESLNEDPLEKLEVKLVSKDGNEHLIGVFWRHDG